MKKYLFIIFSFVLLFFTFSGNVDAKSTTNSDIVARFGSDTSLNLGYSSINSFKIEDDNSFYFDGVNYKFNNDYTLVNDSIEVVNSKFELNDDVLTIDLDKKVVNSEKTYETYSLPLEIEFLKENTREYTFKQELCYKYNETERCSVDKGDITKISSSNSYNYYYSFLPFYKESIKFDYLTYKLTLSYDNSVINFSDLTFLAQEINYKDNFTINGYQNVSKYDGKQFISGSISNGKMYVNLSLIGHGNVSENVYKINVYTYVGNDYSQGGTLVYSIDALKANEYKVFAVELTDLGYDSINNNVEFNSFKLVAEYVCDDISDSRGVGVKTYTNEEVYTLVYKGVSFSGKLNYDKIVEESYFIYTYQYYGVKGSVTNTITFESDIGIVNIYYLLSETKINDPFLINNKVVNDTITIGENLNGKYYLYLRILEASGLNYTNINGIDSYIYLFDCVGPNIKEGSDNFDSYDETDVYSDVEIKVTSYEDNIFTNASEVLFKVISDNEYPLSKEEIIETGTKYLNGVKIKDYINSDGKYMVCFIGKDYLENYGEVECSKTYNLDITKLTKEEVSVTGSNNTYVQNLAINISVDAVNQGVSFKCGLFKQNEVITTNTSLYFNCLNKQENIISFSGEGEYSLWIYASDYVGNYSLIKLDEVYLLDNFAPSVSYNIVGNNNAYSNDVKLNVIANDINGINKDTLSYSFYLNTYNGSEFYNFTLEEGISYPYDYYGTYKVAIKACDNLNNCNTNVYGDNFLIDTGEIKIELNGEKEVKLLKWGKYKEEGVSASKGNNSRVPVSVSYVVSGEVDTNKVGVYYITYSSGEGMNKVSVTRKVIVEDNTSYILIFISLLFVSEAIILLRLFVKKRKNDSI